MYLRLQVISHAPVLQCISCTFIVIVFPNYQALKSPTFLPWLEIPVLYCSQKISNSGYRFVYSRQTNNSCLNASAKLRDYYTSHLCIGFYWKNDKLFQVQVFSSLSGSPTWVAPGLFILFLPNMRKLEQKKKKATSEDHTPRLLSQPV